MTQEEILQYNKKCAEFLEWYYENNKWLKLEPLNGGVIAVLKCNSDFDLKFHSDWNWIKAVLDKISSLNEDDFSDNTAVAFDDLLDLSVFSSKEAVVEAINQFLKWYKNANSN